MNIKTASTIVALVGLTGCSGMLADSATKQAQSQCAAESKQFLPTNVEKHDNPIYSSAEVSGHCVGPGDPGYVAPKSSATQQQN